MGNASIAGLDEMVVHPREFRPQPEITREEREVIVNTHVVESHVDVPVPGEDREERIELRYPRCAECSQPWGTYGCPTIRMLQVLAIRQHERDELAEKYEALNQLALERGAVDFKTWRIPSDMTMRAVLVFDESYARLTKDPEDFAVNIVRRLIDEVVGALKRPKS